MRTRRTPRRSTPSRFSTDSSAAARAKEKNETRDKRERANKSILDFVNEEAKSLEKDLGAADQRKMEEYLTAVRELELRIQRAREVKNSSSAFKPTGPPRPGIPKDAQEHMRLMPTCSSWLFRRT